MRTGDGYIRDLRDERCVYLDGKRVACVPDDPAFRNAVRSVARLYDFQASPENRERMTFETPAGAGTSLAWQMPQSYEDLVRRREALVAWAELHHGFMGRSPDHVASTLAAMAMGLPVYEKHAGGKAGNVRAYYEYARDRDLYVSYVIIDPQGDRSKATSEAGNAGLAVTVVDEDAEGVTIRGSKMLGTGAIMSDEIMVTTLRPLRPEDAHYALTAVIPIESRGVRLLSRRSYEGAATSEFDYPLSSHFDENDALLYFDDVKVPWDRVFVYRDTACQLAQWHQTPAHAYQNYQSEVRLMVKLRFLVGLAHKIAETIGTVHYPSVTEKLGELSSHVATVEAFVLAMEAKGYRYGPYYMPDRDLLYAAQVQAQMIYPKVIHTLRELSGGGVLMLPSARGDFDNPEIADYIGKTQYSPVMSSSERVQLFKLAWDAVGSEFASRHLQYEMFYSGSTIVTHGMAYRHFDWAKATEGVSRTLASYPVPDIEMSPAAGAAGPAAE